MMTFGRKVMAAMMMGLVTASAVAGGAAGKGEGRCGHEDGPSKAMHAGGPGGLALFGIGPFGARPMMPPGMPGMPGEPPHGDGAGKGARAGAVGDAEARLSGEQRARRFEQHLEMRIARVLRRVDGTPEQSRKIAAVVAKAMADIRPLHEQLHALDMKAADLFRADTLDRRAFEQLRTGRLTLMDQISQRSMSAWLDAAALLEPGQRQTLSALRERGRRGAHRGREGDRPAHGRRGEPGPRVGQPAAAGTDAAAGGAR